MSTFFRFLKILNVLRRHRLDTFLRDHKLPLSLQLLLWLPNHLPIPKRSRGERLRQACEDLGPIFVKFGQLLSTRPDLIPEDIVKELDKLQDQVPPFGNDEFRKIVETALDGSIDSLFKQYDHQPLASASVAQVHCATLPSGEEVVIKAIRPGIEKTINQDIQLMRRLAKTVESLSDDGRRLRPVEVVEEYRLTITNELNLQREAANASQLQRNFAHSHLLYVPSVHWPLIQRNVMVMERIHGIPVTDVDTFKRLNVDLKLLAERGVEIFFTQVFEHNFFHADMHPGNVFVDASKPENPSYIAVDMAIVCSLNQEDQYYLARNLLAMFRRDYRMVAELHVMSGWVRKDTNINEFEAAIRSVCEPIFERPLGEISFGQVLITLFQTARQFDMTVQPQLVLLQKTLLNIEGLGRQLYPELDLWSTAHPYLERWLKQRFHPKTLLQQLKRYGPEWMEKFPQVPHLVFEGLEKLNNLDDITSQVSESLEKRKGHSNRSKTLGTLSILALLGAIATSWSQFWPSLQELSPISIGLIVLGAFAWLLR